MLNVAFLVSGNGSNLQFVIDAISHNQLAINIDCVIADRDCFALQRAIQAQIPTHTVKRGADLSAELLDVLQPYKAVTLIVMAGFLSIISSEFCSVWKNKIINIHPSLLPKYGGKGMWGAHVHQAVLASKDLESGCTIHFVTEGVDEGEIILQSSCPVNNDDTVEVLQNRVQALEKKALLAVLQLFSKAQK